MTHIRPSSGEEYALSFLIRECRKDHALIVPDEPEERKKLIENRWDYKFPFRFQPELRFKWEIRQIDSAEELADLWTHRSGNWLAQHGLWEESGLSGVTIGKRQERLQRQNLGVYARRAIDSNFFQPNRFPDTGQYKNYFRWKGKSLQGVLSGQEKPMLVQREGYIDIIDGFGRLLPYLVLVRQGIQFLPFEAYYACL